MINNKERQTCRHDDTAFLHKDKNVLAWLWGFVLSTEYHLLSHLKTLHFSQSVLMYFT
jgi:hypothetical protein